MKCFPLLNINLFIIFKKWFNKFLYMNQNCQFIFLEWRLIICSDNTFFVDYRMKMKCPPRKRREIKQDFVSAACWYKILTSYLFCVFQMLKEPEVGREPLFISIIRSINTSCQVQQHKTHMNTLYTHFTVKINIAAVAWNPPVARFGDSQSFR